MTTMLQWEMHMAGSKSSSAANQPSEPNFDVILDSIKHVRKGQSLRINPLPLHTGIVDLFDKHC